MFGFLKSKKEKELEDKYLKLQMLYSDLEDDYESSKKKYDRLSSSINELEKKEEELKDVIDTKSLEYVDQLEGLEFEEYARNLLIKLNYTNVQKTKASGDFGIDLLAEKDNITYAIQCKLYSSKLGNDCVQEAYAGKQYYDKDLAVVLTNSTFTTGAIELAKKTGVVLWDRDVLDKMLKKVNGTFVEEKRNQELKIDDPMYEEAVEFAIQSGKVSASILQRKFRFGYNRAARLIDIMEANGIIGPANGSKPRDVIVKK